MPATLAPTPAPATLAPSTKFARPALLTVADYQKTPDEQRYQLIAGQLYHMAPAPNRFHQRIALVLATILENHVTQHSLGEVGIAPLDVYLSEHDVVQPDVLFVATARAEFLCDNGIHGAPDLVVEVLSPTTAQLDKNLKRDLYARSGVQELWLVDPILQQIHLYDFARDRLKAVRLVEDEETIATPLLPGLILTASALFARTN